VEILLTIVGGFAVVTWLKSLFAAGTADRGDPLPLSVRTVSAAGRFGFFVGVLAVAMDKNWQNEGHLEPLAWGTGIFLGCQLAYGISVLVFELRDLSLKSPEGLQATVDGLDVTLVWKAVPKAKEYSVFRKAAGEDSEALVETCATTGHRDRVPKPGSYSYHVKARDEREESGFSDTVNVDCRD
jgi:hypothetical protein